MKKNITHHNHLSYQDCISAENVNHFDFVGRGCSFREREQLLNNYKSSIHNKLNRSIDNSYILLEEEPDNRYDPNAVLLLCKGEFFGTLCYVGRKYTEEIKNILNTCKQYRVDLKNRNAAVRSEMTFVISWVE